MYIRDGITVFVLVVAATTNAEITNGPKNITATVGSEVTFECEYQGTNDLPRWRINAMEYSVSDLPDWHWFSRSTGLHVYIISSVMNNTVYVCLVDTNDPESGKLLTSQSEPALLIVLQPIRSTSVSIMTSLVFNETQTVSPTTESEGTFNAAMTNTLGSTSLSLHYEEVPVTTGPKSATTGRALPSETILLIGCGCGALIGVLGLVLSITLGTFMWFRRPKKITPTDSVTDPVYDTISEAIRSGNGAEQEDVPTQQNSAYVIPPPHMKIKVQKNEAYSSVSLQH